MFIPIVVLLAVFILIAVRKIGHIKLDIWQIMLFGALVVLLTKQISVIKAIKSVNIDVMLFLFGMFVVGRAMEDSGYLSHLAYKIFNKTRSVDHLILFILFGMGIISAFLMNDTIAIIGTPVVLLFAKKHNINPKLLLFALAFAITIGTVMSPIGNPQNLLIAINSNIHNPFITFAKFLLIPTLINLFFAYLLLRIFYRKHFHSNTLSHNDDPINDPYLAKLSQISLFLIIILVFVKIISVFNGSTFNFKLTYIALISALPVLLLSRKRFKIIKEIDWHTLIFFASMFILMQSVWDTGFFQSCINQTNMNISSVVMILIISILLSQFISNVPLVALYLPLLIHSGASDIEMVALASGSTIAGNLTILGAASNIIIIQNAEKKSGETLTFLEFLKIGTPLTIINVLVYWIFLSLI